MTDHASGGFDGTNNTEPDGTCSGGGEQDQEHRGLLNDMQPIPPDVARSLPSEIGPNGLDAGGLGCERCYGARGDAHALDSADVANFRALGAARGAGAARTATPKVARAVDDLITWHLGRRPKSRALVHELTQS